MPKRIRGRAHLRPAPRTHVTAPHEGLRSRGSASLNFTLRSTLSTASSSATAPLAPAAPALDPPARLRLHVRSRLRLMRTSHLLRHPLHLQRNTYKDLSLELVPSNLTIRYFRFLELFLTYMRI
jgi:hypothetical protein